MKQNNICKFISPAEADSLTVSCFVLESDPAILQRYLLLAENRVILVAEGEGSFIFGQSEIPFASGTLIFGFAGEYMQAKCDESCRCMYIEFHGSRAEKLFERFGISPENRSFGGFDSLVPLWLESLSRADERSIDLASESVLIYTFSRLSPAIAPKRSVIGDVVKLTEVRFNDPSLSVTSIAEELGYNPKYISHIFKEKMGLGYSQYLRAQRIKYAVNLFNNGLDSIKNVALLSGFTDPLYFSTVFKKNVGVSPKEYLARTLQEERRENP